MIVLLICKLYKENLVIGMIKNFLFALENSIQLEFHPVDLFDYSDSEIEKFFSQGKKIFRTTSTLYISEEINDSYGDYQYLNVLIDNSKTPPLKISCCSTILRYLADKYALKNFWYSQELEKRLIVDQHLDWIYENILCIFDDLVLYSISENLPSFDATEQINSSNHR